jgi:phenylalanyl-tRNA synthetase beta chain
MLLSHNWLKKYLPEFGLIDKEKLAVLLTESLAEVERTIPIRQELEGIFCAEIIEVATIPDSKKLTVCKVKISEEQPLKTVICGAPNVKVGLKVALAIPGGKVYDGHENKNTVITIAQKSMFNVTSDGMICSPKELGISNEHEGIIELESELPIGTDLTEMLKDFVYEIENKSLSHRPDCFSHEGIAREIAAISNTAFIDPYKDIPLVPVKTLPFELVVKVDPETCPRFTTICLSDIKVSKSPLWLKCLLSAVGIRPINNIVDITNFIMLDKGQPLHSYDYDKISGAKLVVKFAKKKEKSMFLNEKEYELDDSMMVIANSSNIENIAGIIGGANSEITDETKNVLLEAGNFNMYSIRKTSKKLGLRTESSTRFEKGLDPNITIKGLKAATQYILDIAHAEVASNIDDYYPSPSQEKTIELDLTSVKRFLGIELTTKEILDYLKKLGLRIEDEEKISALSTVPDTNIVIKVVRPSFRSDLNISNDLLEEIARIYGYGKLKPSLPTKEITAVSMNKGMKFSRKVRSILSSLNMTEIATYSFVGEKLYESLNLDIKNCLSIKNPISPDLGYVRNLIVPNLIEKIIQNKNKYSEISVFELERIVNRVVDESGIHEQPVFLAGGLYEKESSGKLFLKAKGILQKLFSELVIDIKFEEYDEKNDLYKNMIHHGRAAHLILDGQKVGIIGEVAPKVLLNNLQLEGRICFFELNASVLSKVSKFTKKFIPLSIYQEITRDLSLLVPNKISYGKIIEQINSLDIKELTNIELVDIFTDERIGDSQKSITIKISLLSYTKTLTDTEVKGIIDNILNLLSSKLQVKLRTV